MYKHKTTKEQYKQFKEDSKGNLSKLLYDVYINETKNNIHMINFQKSLQMWFLMNAETNYNRGLTRINKYLDSIFV